MKRIVILIGLTLVLILVQQTVFAQCPMCKMAAESNMKSGGSVGKGLNTGILYLLAMPYIIVSILAYIWKQTKRKSESIS
ncbi:MAG: hypothetical protein JNL65_09320 [Saprospiraceae bacterium]|nr:hypothetical protein [Saprospiraceae bacterium]HRG68333.1 hypothetical protein [Saprospiraceae bacterium]